MPESSLESKYRVQGENVCEEAKDLIAILKQLHLLNHQDGPDGEEDNLVKAKADKLWEAINLFEGVQ